MTEIHVLVEEARERRLFGCAFRADIYTEADSIEDLHPQVRDAVRCHSDEGHAPRLIRLHITREEVITAWGFRVIRPEGNCSKGSGGSVTRSSARPAATSA